VAKSFYFDASALAKRYVPEKGSSLVHAILDGVSHNRICLVSTAIGEVVSILVRKRNAATISAAYFGQAYADFEGEILRSADIKKVSVTNRLALSSLPLIIAHSINSNDAVTLWSALAIARRLRKGGDDMVLIASDQRLVRAAQAEGLSTFNPESQDQAALAAFLGP
jgi:predicted nucleic acid-binding protein